jgi:hypothetical protein
MFSLDQVGCDASITAAARSMAVALSCPLTENEVLAGKKGYMGYGLEGRAGGYTQEGKTAEP